MVGKVSVFQYDKRRWIVGIALPPHHAVIIPRDFDKASQHNKAFQSLLYIVTRN